MLIVTCPQVALGIEDPDVRRLVSTRFHQITNALPYDVDVHGEFIVVEPGDTVAELEEVSGCPLLHDFGGARFGDAGFSPVFETIEDHPGCHEVVAIFSDSGAGIILFVPKQPGVDPELLAMCARYAVRAVDPTPG